MILLALALVCALYSQVTAEPAPQFHPSGYHGGRHWSQARNHSFAAPKTSFDFLDPVTSPVVDDMIKSQVPRQSGLYGIPFSFAGRNENFPPQQAAQQPGYSQGYPGSPNFQNNQGFQGPQPSQGFQGQGFQGTPVYPQIYKVDNLIIIANPPEQQACPQTCNIKPLDKNTFPGKDDELDNRLGLSDPSEPTKCTWAIVACCAPGNNEVRYNCFELMGCPGLFLGQNPCTPRFVEAATQSALNFYRSGNSNTTASDTNQL